VFSAFVQNPQSGKNMMRSHKLALHIADTSWGEIRRQLTCKADWYGKESSSLTGSSHPVRLAVAVVTATRRPKTSVFGSGSARNAGRSTTATSMRHRIFSKKGSGNGHPLPDTALSYTW
jgi:hypothetical protein